MKCVLWVESAAGQIPAQFNKELANSQNYSNLERAVLRECVFKFIFLKIEECFLPITFV